MTMKIAIPVSDENTVSSVFEVKNFTLYFTENNKIINKEKIYIETNTFDNILKILLKFNVNLLIANNASSAFQNKLNRNKIGVIHYNFGNADKIILDYIKLLESRK